MEYINFGIIGAGRIGKLHAENLIKNVKGARLKAITDPFIDEDWASSQNIPVFGKDHGIMLDDPEINSIIIGSPSSFHASHIIECAQAGKNIFCEKPIALEPELILAAIKEVEKSGVKLQIGFNRRFDPNFAAIKQKVIDGSIGIPHIIRIVSRDPIPPSLEYATSSGGLFLDMTIHDFDMVRFLSGNEFTEVHAFGSVLIDPEIGKVGDIDTAVISFKLENGALGQIENSRKAVYGYDQRIEVFGSKGSAMAENNLPTNMVLLNKYGTIREKPLYFFLERYRDAFVNELQKFVDTIHNDETPPVTGNDGLAAILIALACNESLQKGKAIKVTSI